MKSTDKNDQKMSPVSIQVGARHKILHDLTGQVVSEMRNRLADLRHETGQPVTQAMLAQALEVNPSSISKALNGDANLTLRKIANIAAATNSNCLFHMTKMLEYTPKKQKNPQNGSSLSAMMSEAREYMRQIFDQGGLFKDTKQKVYETDQPRIRIKPLADLEWEIESSDRYFTPKPKELFGNDHSVDNFSDNILDDCHTGISLGEVLLIISAEFTFHDGFSEVEWVLYDRMGNEHFRSRDLKQVATLASVIVSRGGFQR